jgi:hypothetical protein
LSAKKNAYTPSVREIASRKAFSERLGRLPPLTLACVSYSLADLNKLFQSGIDASLTSSNSKAQWLADDTWIARRAAPMD